MTHPRLASQARRDPDGIGPVRIWLLGGFRVSVGSRSIEENRWRLRKAGSLLKLLALAQGHRLHPEQAMDLLWPELDSEAALNNLHHALHIARRTLKPSASSTASRQLHLQGEHLIEAVVDLVDALLDSCAGLRVLATSREVLNAAGEGIEEEGRVSNPPVLDLLGRLVDKSLAVAEAGEERALRYRMQEPVRQYGQERLEESGEAERIPYEVMGPRRRGPEEQRRRVIRRSGRGGIGSDTFRAARLGRRVG